MNGKIREISVKMILPPLWNKSNRSVSGETGLFRGNAPVKLLFPAEKIVRVYNPSLDNVYLENIHYTHQPGSDLIFPVDGSGICGIGENDIFPSPKNAKIYPADNANAVTGGPDGKLLLFDNGSFFARHQIQVDYIAVAGTQFPDLPPMAANQLPRTNAILAGKKPLTITLIGDSISEGFNATGFVNSPPAQPQYINLFADELAQRSGSKITIHNAAINGTGCRDASDIRDRWLDDPCDLLVIAYGMNDFAALSADEFGSWIKKIMELKKSRHPDTEFILVAGMTRNPLWHGSHDEQSRLFAETIKRFSSPECAVADVHAVWKMLLDKKDFYDLTGNGVNHPNDYGHRVYSTVLSGLFDRK